MFTTFFPYFFLSKLLFKIYLIAHVLLCSIIGSMAQGKTRTNQAVNRQEYNNKFHDPHRRSQYVNIQFGALSFVTFCLGHIGLFGFSET